MNNVNVNIEYTTLQGNIINVDSLITNDNGRFSFSSLIPGPYSIKAFKDLDYYSETIIEVNENETLIQNISINYASISLSGSTLENNTENVLSNITIDYIPDITVENNTAQEISIQSDINGLYEVDIQPGTYNILVNQTTVENNITIIYNYQGKLIIEIGEGLKTFDIMISKVEER